MTQQEMAAHPFFQLFARRLTPVISSMQQRGMLNPNEVGLLTQLLKNSYPQIHSFCENLVGRYGQMSDSQMDNEIFNWIQNPIQMVRARISQMSGGFSMGGGWNNGGGLPWGGGGGGWGGGVPRGFGYDSFSRPQVPQSPFNGGAPANKPTGPDPFAAPPANGSTGSFTGTPIDQSSREKYVQQQMTPDKSKQANRIPWKDPAVTETNTVQLDGEVEVTVSKLELHDGTTAREVVVYDPRVEYVSDSEVLEKYKKIFSIYPETRRKVLTVGYQQLRVIHASQDEILKLTQAISATAGKVNGVEAKLRAVIATAANFNKRAYEEFANLFIDELEARMYCGELCDSAHPKNILNRPAKLEDILAIVSGDINNKAMLDALNGMKGFRDKLTHLLEVLIEEFATGLHRRIINVKSDTTALGGFYRALPGVWTDDCGITLKNSTDLISLFLATREKIDGSKTANAVAAENNLKTKLESLAKEYTLIFVPRVATWCNYSKSDVCRYDDTGNCQPACFSRLQPRNDVEYFVNTLLESWANARDTMLKWAPKNIYLEIDEETYKLQYGRTTDDSTWIGTAIYWH